MTALDIVLKEYTEDDAIPPIKVWNAAILEAIRLVKIEIEVLKRNKLQGHATGAMGCLSIIEGLIEKEMPDPGDELEE